MSARLRLMTFNIHKGIGNDRRYQLERTIAVIAHHQPDIVLLQEVDCGVPRSLGEDQCSELAHALGYPHARLGLNVRVRGGMYGNATLSRLPIGEHANIDLTWWVKKRRSALFTRHPLGDGRTLAVFNIHLGLSRIEREVQVRRLLEDPRLPAPGGGPVVVAGDTNDWRHLLARKLFEPAGFDCATGGIERSLVSLPRAGTMPPVRTFPAWLPVGALDKVYLRDVPRVRDVATSTHPEARAASDHLPVIVDIELR